MIAITVLVVSSFNPMLPENFLFTSEIKVRNGVREPTGSGEPTGSIIKKLTFLLTYL